MFSKLLNYHNFFCFITMIDFTSVVFVVVHLYGLYGDDQSHHPHPHRMISLSGLQIYLWSSSALICVPDIFLYRNDWKLMRFSLFCVSKIFLHEKARKRSDGEKRILIRMMALWKYVLYPEEELYGYQNILIITSALVLIVSQSRRSS